MTPRTAFRHSIACLLIAALGAQCTSALAQRSSAPAPVTGSATAQPAAATEGEARKQIAAAQANQATIRVTRKATDEYSVANVGNGTIVVKTNATKDVIEIEQLLARYAVAMTKDDVEAVVEVFTPDGTYSAFGDTYALADFPTLVAAAPKGLFMTGTPALELDGDAGRGEQPLCFVDQTNHAMRIGWYTDTYRRTDQGWRLATRSMTFLRRSGERDSGRAHDPTRPQPSSEAE